MSDSITVNGNDLSPAARTPSEHARFTNYLYIKGRGPIKAEQKRQLAAIGVTIFEYLGKDVYLCRYEPEDLQPIRDLAFIERADVYPRRLKTSPFLKDAIRSDEQDTSTPAATFKVDIVLHKGELASDAVASEIVEKTGISRDDISIEHNLIRLEADGAAISKIEELDEVKAIEPFIQKKLFNNVAREVLEVYNDASPVLPEKVKYEGKGQIVAVADTGFDLGDLSDVHPAFKGRVTALIAEGRKAKKQTNDYDSHGTHVAGSVLGDGTSESMGGKIQGTAPKASLVMQSLLVSEPRGGLFTPDNLWDLFVGPYKIHQARVATNSWGADWDYAKRQLEYNNEAGAIDRFVWHQPDHVILFAAGNDGRERSATKAHIGASSAAKNCICVGATESKRGSKGAVLDPKNPKGDPTKIADFSSRGPTLERRIKPDVVAPGVVILSASSRDKAVTNKIRNEYGTTTDSLWQFGSGTSMSTPLVAGCAAVLREALQEHDVKRPSAALVKALLVNGAVDLGKPRAEQGFGRVNIKRSLACIEESEQSGYVDSGHASVQPLKEDEEWVHQMAFPAPENGTLHVTLAYSDRYGPALQNNLALTVIIQGSGADVEKKGDEGFLEENNVEKVVYKLPKEELKVRIRVTAERIARLDDSQPFSVVWGIY